MHQRCKLFFFVPVLMFCLDSAFAGAPFISEDPDALPKGSGEFFFFSAYNKVGSARAFGFPGFEFDYGLIKDVEFNGVVTYLLNYPNKQNQVNTSGLGDTQLEIKYRFIHETDYIPEVAFAPVYFAPAGNFNRNLGNGRPWIQLPLWLQKSWSSWTLYGGGGYALNAEPTTRNCIFGGFVLQKDINDSWTLGAEIYSSGTAAQDTKSYALLNLGGFYHITKKIDVLFSAGQNFLGQQNTVGYLGLDWSFG